MSGNIVELFVDQDGVVADFKKRYAELYQSDAVEDYNDKRPEVKKKHHERFRKIVLDGHFENLDPMPDFEEGIEFLERINIEHKIPVCFLTSTATEEYLNELSRQKRNWLKKHNVRFFPVFVPGKRMKCYYAKPGKILIDDTYSTIVSWEQNFGIGIHHKSWKETIEIISELL